MYQLARSILRSAAVAGEEQAHDCRVNDEKEVYMKSLQLLAGMSVVALAISGCSTWNATSGTNAATGNKTFWSGQENPNTGKYVPSYPMTPPPPKT